MQMRADLISVLSMKVIHQRSTEKSVLLQRHSFGHYRVCLVTENATKNFSYFITVFAIGFSSSFCYFLSYFIFFHLFYSISFFSTTFSFFFRFSFNMFFFLLPINSAFFLPIFWGFIFLVEYFFYFHYFLFHILILDLFISPCHPLLFPFLSFIILTFISHFFF